MTRCYLLTVCSSSSVDQQTNNVSLFNLVEQINVPPKAPPPPRGLIPLEIHAYWQLDPNDLSRDFEMRFVMVASSGLETPTDVFRHRSVSERFRTRTVGLPFPPVVGMYQLRVDWRRSDSDEWRREPPAWPVNINETVPKPRVTH